TSSGQPRLVSWCWPRLPSGEGCSCTRQLPARRNRGCLPEPYWGRRASARPPGRGGVRWWRSGGRRTARTRGQAAGHDVRAAAEGHVLHGLERQAEGRENGDQGGLRDRGPHGDAGAVAEGHGQEPELVLA